MSVQEYSNEFVNFLKDTYEKELLEIEHNSQKLSQAKLTIDGIIQGMRSTCKDVFKEHEQLESSITKLEAKNQVNRSRISKLSEEEGRLLHESEQRQLAAAFNQECSLVNSRQLELEVSAYGDCLGLKVSRIPGNRLQIAFTVFPKLCGFIINRNEDNMYTILDCQPRPKDLDQMVQLLNVTRDFRSFLIVLRAKFQAYFEHYSASERQTQVHNL